MGGAGSKADSPEEGGEKVVIKNSTKEEVVIREKNRKVLGPVRYTIPAEEEARVPCVKSGTYMRHAVLVGKEEIGIISTDDLEKSKNMRKPITIRGPSQNGKYEVIKEDPSHDSSEGKEMSPLKNGSGPSAV